MANTGYITSSGILQTFTTGPYSGSEVTSSYSIGSTLFGGIINTFQPFISGDIDSIITCPEDVIIIPGVNYFERLYYDPYTCPPDNICLSPILVSANRESCEEFDSPLYNIIYDSGSSIAGYTIVEYSTISNFSVTGSTIIDNSLFQSPLDVNINGLEPSPDTPIYFRAYNSCSNGFNSNYSNTIISNNCSGPSSTISPFTFNIVNQTGYLVKTTDGNGNGVDGPWYNIPTSTSTFYNFNDLIKSFFIKIASPTSCPDNRIYIELSTTSLISGIVTTTIGGVQSGDCVTNLSTSTTSYNPLTGIYLQYPTPDIDGQLSTLVSINRTNWLTEGNITMTIKYSPFQGIEEIEF
jgi:hypothetical protein